MQLGIFSKTFVRDTSGEALDAVAAHGLTCVQFNFETAGLADMPDRFAPDLCRPGDRRNHPVLGHAQ